MQIVNIHEAKTQLSRLVEQAVKGDAFIIAKAGAFGKSGASGCASISSDMQAGIHVRADQCSG